MAGTHVAVWGYGAPWWRFAAQGHQQGLDFRRYRFCAGLLAHSLGWGLGAAEEWLSRRLTLGRRIAPAMWAAAPGIHVGAWAGAPFGEADEARDGVTTA